VDEAIKAQYADGGTKPLILHVQYNSSKVLQMFLVDKAQQNGYNFKGFEAGLWRPQLSENNFIVFDITLVQTELSTADPRAICHEYTEQTLLACTEERAEEEFGFFGCLPPWFTDNEGKVCKPSMPGINETFRTNKNKYRFTLEGWWGHRESYPKNHFSVRSSVSLSVSMCVIRN
jgi:hypothetical protein